MLRHAVAAREMTIPGVAYSRPARIAAGALASFSAISLLVMGGAIVLGYPELDNQLRLLRTFVLFGLAPAAAAWLLARAFVATVTIESGQLAVTRRDRRVEVPCASVTAVEPWRVPMPAAGFDLRLRSGRRFPYGLHVADPAAFVAALVAAGAPDAARGLADPAMVYAASQPRSRWWSHPLVKFVALALVPTLPLFRLHQWIAYGDTFGEYYTYGLQAYVLAFAIFWSTFTIYLVLYAAALRLAAEVTMAVAAWAAPARNAGLRRVVEIACGVLYVGGLGAFLLRVALLTA